VTLTEAQVNYAHSIARSRQSRAPARQAHGATGGLGEHLAGAEGEMAFGTWLYGDQPFRLTVDTYRSQPDFPDTEVRTRSREDYELIIRADDEPAYAYVLVLPAGEHAWCLQGWLWGREVQERWLATHGGREAAYFVPQAATHGMHTYRGAMAGLGVPEPVKPVSMDERVAEYLTDCAAVPWLERKYHPTAAGALKLIYHRGPDEAAAIKAAFEAQS
jgi:hypothetical protein